ncbi:hypothetical protein SDC9_155280 [bioreactor metagenome]|uniref:Uncharacterized protein n=1 Tax=bioreactor metagenome TaxID=1076179 RepID=A0A645F5W7_9ZZZZ
MSPAVENNVSFDSLFFCNSDLLQCIIQGIEEEVLIYRFLPVQCEEVIIVSSFDGMEDIQYFLR